MPCLLVKIRTNQEKLRAGQEHLKEEIRAGQELLKEEMLAKMETSQEIMAVKLDTHHEMMSRMESKLEKMEAAVDVFEKRLKKMYTTDFKANLEKSEDSAEQ
jgi:hypothetical protein